MAIDPDARVVWVVARVTSLSRDQLSPAVCAVLTPERVSAYSHSAVNVWRLGVPVLTGVDVSRWADGAHVLVDFDTGEIREGTRPSAAAHPPRASAMLDVLAEVAIPADLPTVSIADGIGVVNVEGLVRLGRDDARRLCAELADVHREALEIRFFDHHPVPSAADATMGYRGARVALDGRAVDLFLRWVDDLDLAREPTVVLPMYAHADEFEAFARRMAPLTSSIGVTVECPEAALCLGQIVDRCSSVEIGLNDLTQFTVAWNRDVVSRLLMPTDRISEGVAVLIDRVSAAVVGRPIRYSLGLDLRPSPALVDRIAALGVPAISCPAVLAARWKALMPTPG